MHPKIKKIRPKIYALDILNVPNPKKSTKEWHPISTKAPETSRFLFSFLGMLPRLFGPNHHPPKLSAEALPTGAAALAKTEEAHEYR